MNYGMRFLLAAALVLPLACASSEVDGTDIDQSQRARYGGRIGESPVGVIPEATIRDATRGRDVLMNIEYPTRQGPHPMIVFSHAYGSTHRDYVGLSSYWASQGYVVVKPRHADGGRAGEQPLLPEISGQTASDWRERARDITFILDSLDALEQKYPELAGKIDRTKIGVAGHQYGAQTAMLLAGARTFPGGTSYADKRVTAALLMSPPGPLDSLGLTRESWTSVAIPVLYMTGASDIGTAETQTVEWRRQAFDLAAPGDKWLMLIENAGNAAFTGRNDPMAQAMVEGHDPVMAPDPNDPMGRRPRQQPTVSRRDSRGVINTRNAFGTVRTMSLAFWDAYLRGDAEGRSALEAAGGRSGVILEKR